MRLDLRVGTIVEADYHPQADKLLVLKINLGEEQPRQLVAGIRRSYEPAELIGQQVVVVANLKPAILRGLESQGMILAASDEAGVSIVRPQRPTSNGSTVK
jgi:methionyl-tRNA synthetase